MSWHAERHAVLETDRNGNGRCADEVHRYGADVFHVEGQRIGEGAEFERGTGSRRCCDDVAELEGFVEFLFQEGADFERFQIVRIIVAGREDVVPEHDAALHFFTEALASGLDIHIDDIFTRCTEAVADAVIAGEVELASAGAMM